MAANPAIHIIDPFDNLRKLLDRYETYSAISYSDLNKAGLFRKTLDLCVPILIEWSTSLFQGEVFVPPFVDLVSSDVDENVRKLREAGVRYPFGMPTFIISSLIILKLK